MLTRYRYSSLREGLVGHWRPSRGCTGNTLLDSVRGNHGTMVNGPTWQASGSGLALGFDGSNDYVDLGNRVKPLIGATTFAVWIRPADLANFQIICCTDVCNAQYAGWWLQVANNGGYGLSYGNNSGFGPDARFSASSPSSLFISGVWSHIAGVSISNSNTQLYFNGRPVTTSFSGNATSLVHTTANARIGAPGDGGGQFLNAMVDDLAIFARQVTASEILTLYTAGRGALDQRVNVPVVRGFTASGGYTLVCDHATFSQTGQDVGLTASRRLTADQATYSETGQDANVLAQRLLTTDNGTYTVSGQDAAFTATGSLVGDLGTFVLSGQDANLVRGRTLTADFGAFVSTGQDASLTRSRVVVADQTTFTLAGQNATLTYSGATDVPYLELDFTSNNAATGSLTATSATGSLVALHATGTLVVSDTET